MSKFKFRAECVSDVWVFEYHLCAEFKSTGSLAAYDETAIVIHRAYDFGPDVDVEIECDGTIEDIRKIMNKVEDSHVMQRTLEEIK